MALVQLPRGFQLDPVDKGPPEALVVVLQDPGVPAEALRPLADRWAPSVPSSAFVVFDGLPQSTLPERPLAPLIHDQLRARRLDVDRLVLVGFAEGGTLALRLLLQQGWNCAGVLAFAARSVRPLSRMHRVDHKIRLIDCDKEGDADYSGLRDFVATLTALGLDARGILLPGSPMSDEAIRHGGAYLAELVATAQRRDRFPVDREWRRSAARLGTVSE